MQQMKWQQQQKNTLSKQNSLNQACMLETQQEEARKKKPNCLRTAALCSSGLAPGHAVVLKLWSVQAAAGSCSHQLYPTGSQVRTQLSSRENSALKTRSNCWSACHQAPGRVSTE